VRYLAEEAQAIRLVTPFLVLTGEPQGLLGKALSLLQAARQQMGLAQGETTEHLKASHVHGTSLFQRQCEQRHGVGDTPSQGVRRSRG
jgi:hypothetical protein